MLRNIRLDHLSVGLSVRKVYCGKTAEWIRMPFRVVSGVGRWMGVLEEMVIVEGEGAVLWMNLGRPIVISGVFATWLFSDYLEDLLLLLQFLVNKNYHRPIPR